MIHLVKKIYPIVVLLLAGSMSLLAQEPVRLSLQEAINYAYGQNLTIKNAQINVEDAEQQIIERRAFGLPQLNADASYTRYLETPKVFFPPDLLPPGTEGPSEISFVPLNSFTANLTLDAMIFDGTFFVGLQAARAFRDYTAQELVVNKRDVRNNVIDAYLPVLLLDESIGIIRKNIANVEKLIYETKELYQAGFAEQLDVDRQQWSLTNLNVELENLLRQREVTVARLKYLIGFPPEQSLELTENLDEIVTIAGEGDLNSPVDLQRRPEYVLVEKGLELNELQLRLNKAAYLPTLRAFGTYQQAYQGNTPKDDFWAPAAFVGARINVPIFDGLEKKAKVERSRLALQTVQNQQLDLERAIKLEVESARTTYANALRTLESQKANLSLGERIYESTQIKFREGVGSSVELAQAEQGLYQAQSSYIDALYNLFVAKVNLETALGK